MNLSQLSQRALEIRKKYAELETEKFGIEWTVEQIAEGFAGDVEDLIKLTKERAKGESVAEKEKLAHELSDCLWSVLVLADKFGVDLEQSFLQTMSDLEIKIDREKAI
ncbi:nucleotide pyrophosphohydrolase [Candidatus Roizmanbacteria bacterium]|nr:nucleotide pyrophosphohydrolase [Candidatus Roizmanbacteria bacterium]